MGPVRSDSRKHLFIDDAIIDQQENVQFRANPPGDRRVTDLKSGGDHAAIDLGSRVAMFSPRGYEIPDGNVFLYTSTDGVQFTSADGAAPPAADVRRTTGT